MISRSESKPLVISIATIMIVVLLCLSTPVDLSADWGYEQALLYSDIVIQGTIVDCKLERVPPSDFMPGPSRTDSIFPISVITINIIEVLKGHFNDELFTAIIPGGHPSLSAGMSGRTYNYEVGDEIILPLTYSSTMRGGSYTLRGDTGRFLRRNGVWVNQRSQHVKLDLEEIKTTLLAASPQSIAEEADIVGLATVVDIQKFSSEGATIEIAKVQFDDLWKGSVYTDVVDVHIPRQGAVTLTWFVPFPILSVGDKWLLFLKSRNNHFYPFAGTNGIFRVSGDNLIQDNNIKHFVSKTEYHNLVTREKINEK